MTLEEKSELIEYKNEFTSSEVTCRIAGYHQTSKSFTHSLKSGKPSFSTKCQTTVNEISKEPVHRSFFFNF